MEDTLSVSDDKLYRKLYPMPKMRDFYKQNSYGRTFLDWECPLLIRDFAKIVESEMQKQYPSSGYKAEDIVGMQFTFRKSLITSYEMMFNIYLYDKNNENQYHINRLSDIVFDKKANTPAEAKKMILNFIKGIYNDPGSLNKLGNYLVIRYQNYK